MDQIGKISEFVIYSFLRIWPYLVLTISIAVAVRIPGGAKYVNKTLAMMAVFGLVMRRIFLLYIA